MGGLRGYEPTGGKDCYTGLNVRPEGVNELNERVDPRLVSTEARKAQIKSLVPSLDFSLLRGGHRKPAAPVAQLSRYSRPC